MRVKISNREILEWLTSNSKITERSNLEWSNLRVTKIGNKNWEVIAPKLIYIKGQIWELAKLRVVRNFE